MALPNRSRISAPVWVGSRRGIPALPVMNGRNLSFAVGIGIVFAGAALACTAVATSDVVRNSGSVVAWGCRPDANGLGAYGQCRVPALARRAIVSISAG